MKTTDLSFTEAVEHLMRGNAVESVDFDGTVVQLRVLPGGALYWHGPDVQGPFTISMDDIQNAKFRCTTRVEEQTVQELIKDRFETLSKQISHDQTKLAELQQRCTHPNIVTTKHSNFSDSTCPDCNKVIITPGEEFEDRINKDYEKYKEMCVNIPMTRDKYVELLGNITRNYNNLVFKLPIPCVSQRPTT